MITNLDVKSINQCGFINITSDVQMVVADSNIKSGVCYLHVPHTTAGITINEGADPSVLSDILLTLNKLVSKDPNYTHMEGNSDAHVKSTLTGVDLNILIENGKLLLGTWQAIFFCEYDGPRNRKVFVKVIEG